MPTIPKSLLSLGLILLAVPCLAQSELGLATVKWEKWDKAAFATAGKQDRLVLLYIAPGWSHYANYMDRETYGVVPIAAQINQNYIAVRVDPDARPDIDSRYQALATAFFRENGWPLSSILLNTGEPVAAASAISPDASMDLTSAPISGGVNVDLSKFPLSKGGMMEFLRKPLDSYVPSAAANKEEAAQKLASIRTELTNHIRTLDAYQNKTTLGQPLSPVLLDKFADSLRGRSDPKFGGFMKTPEGAPKAINGGAIRLCLALGQDDPASRLDAIATQSLDAILNGAVHDRVAGGFHHYAIDRNWQTPRYEKLLAVNADALLACVDGYNKTQDPRYRQASLDTLDFMMRVLYSPEGGFRASQAANSATAAAASPQEMARTILDREGEYYRWTLSSLAHVLSKEELALVKAHYGLKEPAKTEQAESYQSLAVAAPLESAAPAAGIAADEAPAKLAAALLKMKAERARRPAPPVDGTIYTDYNGLAAAAILRAARVFDAPGARAAALEALDKIWARAYQQNRGLVHATSAELKEERFLSDQACFAYGLLAAYETTGEIRYLKQAGQLMDWTWEFLRDAKNGGLRDRLSNSNDAALLTMQWKPVQDWPNPAGNAVAAWVYDRLYYLTRDAKQKERAGEILEALAGRAGNLGWEAGWFGLALAQHLDPPTTVIVLGDPGNALVQGMTRAALADYDHDRIVLALGPTQEEGRVLAGGQQRKGEAVAYVCVDARCSQPAANAEDLKSAIVTFTRSQPQTVLGATP